MSCANQIADWVCERLNVIDFGHKSFHVSFELHWKPCLREYWATIFLRNESLDISIHLQHINSKMFFLFDDPTIPSLRGILIARLIAPGGPAYIVEIMRRPRKISTEDGKIKDAEEPFQGLVFRLNNENQLIPWLRQVMARIRHENGVFKRLTGSCPGIAHSFSHRFSSKIDGDSLPCESIVLAALAKLNNPPVRAGFKKE